MSTQNQWVLGTRGDGKQPEQIPWQLIWINVLLKLRVFYIRDRNGDALMDFDPFRAAVQQAKVIVGEKRWHALNFAAQSAMIYQQLRLIDAELVGAPLARKNNASA